MVLRASFGVSLPATVEEGNRDRRLWFAGTYKLYAQLLGWYVVRIAL